MKRVIISLLSMTFVATMVAGELSATPKGEAESLVYVDGMRYYIHTVVKGDTLYSLAKRYGVTTSKIIVANPVIRDGFNEGLNIKIPYYNEADSDMSERKLKKNYDTHTVAAGETLYAISREYEVSVASIMENNPDLDPTSISIGQQINIRKADRGQADEAETRMGLNRYRDQLNKVVDNGLAYHLVVEGETLASLTKMFDMQRGEIARLNDIEAGDDVVVGSLILVRSMDDGADVAPLRHNPRRVDFAPLNENDTLEVALLLPLSIRGYAMQPFVEFYQGFLLGVEDLKKGGHNVVVNLFNTEKDASKIGEIMRSEGYQSSDIIVGPVYEKMLPSVLADAERRGVPVVSPLVTLKSSDSPVLFQMAPEPTKRFDKMSSLLRDETRVTLIYGESTDSLYERQILDQLEMHNKEFGRYDYKYEHPTVIAEREKRAEERLREALEEARFYGTVMDSYHLDTLVVEPSPSDLTPLIRNELKRDVDLRHEMELEYRKELIKMREEARANGEESKISDSLTLEIIDTDSLYAEGADSIKQEVVERELVEYDENLFVILSNNETEVDRILSALSSAYTSQVARYRGSRINVAKKYKYSVVASPAWSKYKNIDRTLYFSNKAYDFPSYLAGRDSEVIRDFDGRYAEEFGGFATLYSYRGYDVAKIFGEGMYNDIESGMEGEGYKPLQSEYRFERLVGSDKVINTNWMRVGYNHDYSLTIE